MSKSWRCYLAFGFLWTTCFAGAGITDLAAQSEAGSQQIRMALIQRQQKSSTNPLSDIKQPGSEVSFRLYNRHMVVVQGSTIDGYPLNLMIDTGSTHSVVDERIVQKLQLKPLPETTHTLEAFGQSLDRPRVLLRGLQFGPIRTSLLCFVAGLPWSGVDAIIGLDLLRQNNFTIDFESKKINFGPRTTHFLSKIPFEADSSQVIVAVRIGEQRVRLSLDTGARTINLYRSRMSKSIRSLPVKRDIPFVHVGGTSLYREVLLPSVQLNGSQWEQVPAMLMDFYNYHSDPVEFDGFLGLGALKIKRIYIDFQKPILSWER